MKKIIGNLRKPNPMRKRGDDEAEIIKKTKRNTRRGSAKSARSKKA